MKQIATLALLLTLFIFNPVFANNLRINNVGFVNNNTSTQTVGIRFTISWENSWKDSINWDAAWVFAKFKHPSSGLWLPLKFNPGSGVNGTGTNASIQVTSDSLGAFIYRNTLSSGVFSDTNIIINWKYGNAGVSSLASLEFRLMAMEMVYIPQGQFQLAQNESATRYADYLRNASNRDSTTYPKGAFPSKRILGSNYAIPTIDTNKISIESITWGEISRNDKYYGYSVPNDTIVVKGDLGIDTNKDGIIDNFNYPTGYKAFYIMKYEMSEQQYADFLNTLTNLQISNLGIAGRNISLLNGKYVSTSPNRSCGGAIPSRFFAYADWSALRPMSFMEFEKAHRGPISEEFDVKYDYLISMDFSPNQFYFQNENGTETLLNQILQSYYFNNPDSAFLLRGGLQNSITTSNYNLARSGVFGREFSNRKQIVATYYGVIDLISNAMDLYISPKSTFFTKINGDGIIENNGLSNISTWVNLDAFLCSEGMAVNTGFNNDFDYYITDPQSYHALLSGFRFVRSAE